MLNKNLLRGHSPAPWKGRVHRWAMQLALDNIPAHETYPTSSEKLANANLVKSAPDLLAEHDVLCELVEAYEQLRNPWDYKLGPDQVEELQMKITTLRGRLYL